MKKIIFMVLVLLMIGNYLFAQNSQRQNNPLQGTWICIAVLQKSSFNLTEGMMSSLKLKSLMIISEDSITEKILLNDIIQQENSYRYEDNHGIISYNRNQIHYIIIDNILIISDFNNNNTSIWKKYT